MCGSERASRAALSASSFPLMPMWDGTHARMNLFDELDRRWVILRTRK